VLYLAANLSRSDSIGTAVSETTLLEIRVLIALVSLGGDVSFDQLVQAAGPERSAQCEVAVDGLEALGLAFWSPGRLLDERRIVVPKAVRDSTPLPAPMRYRLASNLSRFDNQSIQRIADNLDISIPDANHQTVLNGI